MCIYLHMQLNALPAAIERLGTALGGVWFQGPCAAGSRLEPAALQALADRSFIPYNVWQNCEPAPPHRQRTLVTMERTP